MKLFEPAACRIDIESGVMTGATGRYEKRLSELRALYRDQESLDRLIADKGDIVAYEVYDFRPSAAAGDMIFGVTRMIPGRVGEEYFMTRGHIHAKADRPEVYYGQKGRGLMHLESPEGETRMIELVPQGLCYVPPFWIHRSINIGSEEFVMMFSYPADSGQDYGIIERSGGLRHRVVADESGSWRMVGNPEYTPRSCAEIDLLTASAT